MLYDYTEGGRLAYDSWCASYSNVEPEIKIHARREPAETARDKRQQSEPVQEQKTIQAWESLSKEDKKRWVDIAVTVVTHFSTVSFTLE